MKLLLLLSISLASFAVLSCAPMTPADYAKSKAEQAAKYPPYGDLYHNGQTSAQLEAALKHENPLLANETRFRPAGGWDSRSWEYLEEQAFNHRVAKVQRLTYGGMTSYLAAAVYHHRVYFNEYGKSIGWYVTQD